MAPGPGLQARRLRGSSRLTARIHSRRCAASTGNLRVERGRQGGKRRRLRPAARTHWWKEMPRSRLRPLSRALQPSAEQLRVMAASSRAVAPRSLDVSSRPPSCSLSLLALLLFPRKWNWREAPHFRLAAAYTQQGDVSETNQRRLWGTKQPMVSGDPRDQ